MKAELINPQFIEQKFLTEWDNLVEHSFVQNVFFHPLMLVPALKYFKVHQNIHLFTLRNDKNELITVFPVIFENNYKNLPIKITECWKYPHYCFLSMPLFHKEYLEISIKKTKEFFAQYGVMLCLNEVYKQKEFTHLIKKSTKVNFYNQYERACLSTDMDFKNYWESALLKKKRKELNRLFNRLSDTGNITFHKIINPDADYINEFIALEASGYKGKENIAISSTIDKLNFIKDITHNPYHSIQTELYSLNANGNMIAALLGFKSGNRFFAFKTGYNEDYTKYSPGVLLMCEVTKSLLNTDPNIIADSCAIPNHPMINSLWRSRIQIASPEIAVSSFIAPSIIMMINFFKTVKSKLR